MKPRTKALLAALLLFASGAVVGGAIGAIWALQAFGRMLQTAPDERALADVGVLHAHRDISEALDLDEPTRIRLLAELQHSAYEVKRVRSEGVKNMAQEFHRAGARIAALLPEEKRPAFYALARKRLHLIGLDSFVPSAENGGALPPANPPPPAPK